MRQIEAVAAESHDGVDASGSVRFPWPVLVLGGALAAYNPWLGIAAGVISVGSTIYARKDRRWVIIGLVIIAISVLLLVSKNKEQSGREGVEV